MTYNRRIVLSLALAATTLPFAAIASGEVASKATSQSQVLAELTAEAEDATAAANHYKAAHLYFTAFLAGGSHNLLLEGATVAAKGAQWPIAQRLCHRYLHDKQRYGKTRGVLRAQAILDRVPSTLRKRRSSKGATIARDRGSPPDAAIAASAGDAVVAYSTVARWTTRETIGWWGLAGGGIVAVVGGVIWGSAASNQSTLDELTGTRDDGGLIDGLTFADYYERQDSANFRRRAGVATTTVGAVIFAASGFLLWRESQGVPVASLTWTAMPRQAGLVVNF